MESGLIHLKNINYEASTKIKEIIKSIEAERERFANANATEMYESEKRKWFGKKKTFEECLEISREYERFLFGRQYEKCKTLFHALNRSEEVWLTIEEYDMIFRSQD